MFYSEKKANILKTIIISRTDKIGDLVLSIPSFVTCKKMYPDARIIVLVRSYNAPIISHLKCIDEVVEIDKYSFAELVEKMKGYRADAFVALYSDSLITRLASRSNAKFKVGPLSKFSSFFTYKHGIRQKRSESLQNEAQYNLDLIKRLNPTLFESVGISNTKIVYTTENQDFIDKFLQSSNIGSKFVLLHPFTGGSAKNLTEDEYVKVLKEIRQRREDINIVISCAKDDKDRAHLMVQKAGYPMAVFVGEGSILDLAALIDRCAVFVGASTGPTHIAGNLQKRCVCIYPNKKTQSKTRWGLYLNDDNVSYIVVDKDNVNEDYSKKTFDKVTDNLLESIALEIIGAYDGNK